MLRKILISSAILIASTNTVLANPAPYLGVGTGVVVNTDDNYFRGMPLNLFAGYGGLFNDNIYLGGEVFGTLGTATLTKGGNDDNKLNAYPYVQSSYAYGASFLPGIALSDHTVAYARLGVIRTRFEFRQTVVSPSKITKTTQKETSTLTGGQFGVGLQTCLTQNIDVRGEYDFAAYHKKGDGFDVQPRQDFFNVNFIYKFD